VVTIASADMKHAENKIKKIGHPIYITNDADLNYKSEEE